jgi:RimJ/RimL family protein N-acetyltransferase
VELTTARLILREYVAADWSAVHAYQSDERYLEHYPWESRTEADVREFVQQIVGWAAAQPRHRFQLAITLADGGDLIGSCGLRLSEPGATTGDIGCELAPACWRQGYASEALAAILEFGFGELGLNRIETHTVSENAPAIRLVERLGFTREGMHREVLRVRGRWRDLAWFGLLKREWEARA